MQGYLKLQEVNEELYEINGNFKRKMKIWKEKQLEATFKSGIYRILNFLIHIYFSFVILIKKWFHIITVKEIYSGLIFILPYDNYEREKVTSSLKFQIPQKCHERRLKKCIPKIKKLMQRYQISTLVLSEELRKDEMFLKSFQDNRILKKEVHILSGKKVMSYLIKEIIEYILQKQGKTTALEDLYLFIKSENSQYKENIAFLAQWFKTINIVTPCLKGYQKLANQLGENAMITVTNNKKKSLRKAKWIVNFDVPIEEMKKYTIYRTATILYLQEGDVYKENTFEGIHICKAGIDVSHEIKDFFEEQYLTKQCSITVLYESTLVTKRNFKAIKEQMKKDKVKIEKLYGSRGLLAEEEYRKVG